MSIFSSIAKAAGVVAAPFTGGASLLPSLVSGGLSLPLRCIIMAS